MALASPGVVHSSPSVPQSQPKDRPPSATTPSLKGASSPNAVTEDRKHSLNDRSPSHEAQKKLHRMMPEGPPPPPSNRSTSPGSDQKPLQSLAGIEPSASGDWSPPSHGGPDTKPFQCGLCSVTFDVSVELVTHVHQHSRTKPFQCGYCKVSYDSDPELSGHVHTHAVFLLHLQRSAVHADRGGVYSDRGGVYSDRRGVYSDIGGVYSDRGGVYSDRSGVYSDRGGVETQRGGVEAHMGGLQPVSRAPPVIHVRRKAVDADNHGVETDLPTSALIDVQRKTVEADNAGVETNLPTSAFIDVQRKTVGGDSAGVETFPPTSPFLDVQRKTVDADNGGIQLYPALTAPPSQSQSADLPVSALEPVLMDEDSNASDGASVPLADSSEGSGEGSGCLISVPGIHHTNTRSAAPANSSAQHVGSEMILDRVLRREKKVKPETVSISQDTEILDREMDVKREEGAGCSGDKNLTSNKEAITVQSKPFRCDICDAGFKATRYVKDHKRRVHKVASRRLETAARHSQDSATDETTTPSPSDVAESKATRRTTRNHATRTNSESVSDANTTSIAAKKTGATEESFECSICGKVLKNSKILKRHNVFVHSDRRPFPCAQCSLSFKTKQSLNGHASSVHDADRPYPCGQCSARLKTQTQLSAHVRGKHSHDRPFPCALCPDSFQQKRDLSAHILANHYEGEGGGFGVETTITTTTADHNHEKPYPCLRCPLRFKLKGALSSHVVKKHNSGGADTTGGAVVGGSDPRPCHCPHCALKFKKKSLLGYHVARVHENRRPFPCPHCVSVRFKSKSELSVHVHRKHSAETPHQCAHCGKCFKVKAALKQHFCKPKDCPVCGRLLNCRSSYENHMRVKHSSRNFRCGSCDLAFLTPRQLEVHTRTHTKEKPYTCEFCGQSFAMFSYLTYHRNGRHLNTRPYTCPLCQKGFNSHSGLWQHKRRHAGVKKYHCPQCEKKFYNSGSLQQHALTHTELRSYVCSVCDKTYRSHSSLKYHRKHSHQL